MAFQLLQRVAQNALNTIGGAATGAFNYLAKNAPTVIDQGQQKIADFGQFLQKTPDTTIRTNAPFKSPNDIITEIVTGLPGQVIRDTGKLTEHLATPENRQAEWNAVKQIPKQTSDLFKGGVKNVPANAGKLLDNPAVSDALTASMLFDLGAGSLKLFGKGAVKSTEKAVAKEVVGTAAKQEANVAADATKTILKTASEDNPNVIKKTTELWKGNEAANRKIAIDALQGPKPTTSLLNAAPTNQELALKALEDSRKGAGQVVTDIAKETGQVIEPIKTKTAQIFQKGTDLAKKWINTREGFTNWRAGDIKRNPLLTQFDKEGMNAIVDLQSGKNAARYQPIKDFTDGLHKLETEAGILRPDQYKQNYLPQMWDNTPEEIQQVFKKTVGGTPSFSKSRLFEDYTKGIEAGLKPRYNTISDLLESRFRTAQRALADNEFVQNLVKSGQAKTLDKAPAGWQRIDLQHEGKALAVAPDTAKIVQNYTMQPNQILQKSAEFVAEGKQTLLTAGVPGTGINFHAGVNIPIRAAAARNNPFKSVVDSVIWDFHPKSALKSIENTPKNIVDGLLKGGMTASRSVEGNSYGFRPKVTKGIIGTGRDIMDKAFSEATFDKILPAQKIKYGWEVYEKAMKSGVREEEAFKIAANASNTMFSGINTEELGRNKDVQNILRTLLLAPDWMESNIRIGKNTGALLNPANWNKPEYAPYKRFALSAFALYSSNAVLNKALSGHWPWENGAGNEFKLATGTFDERGRERMLKPFGTAFDFLRVPVSIVSGMSQGDSGAVGRAIRNRLSPPVGAAVSTFITNQDYRGRPVIDAEKSLGNNIAGVASQLATAVGVPSQITNTIQALRGESTPEELAGNLLEAPISYNGGARNASQIETAKQLKASGASNEQVNKAFASSSGGGASPLAGLFGKPDYSTLGSESNMPKTKAEKIAFDKSVDTALANGADLPDRAIITRFFNGKTYDKSARKGQQDILNAMLKVADDEYLSPEQKAKIANAANIDAADLQYYRSASMDQDSRLEGLLQYAASADPKDRNTLMENLILGKKEVGGKSLFSTSMFDRLYDEGIISKDEKALIAAVKYDPIYHKFYVDRDYKGAGGVTSAQARSYMKSVNALFKKSPGKAPKQVQALAQPEAAPQIALPSVAKGSKTSTKQWFTPY